MELRLVPSKPYPTHNTKLLNSILRDGHLQLFACPVLHSSGDGLEQKHARTVWNWAGHAGKCAIRLDSSHADHLSSPRDVPEVSVQKLV